MGNIVGSNIFNIFFILGISAVIYPVKVQANAILDMGMNLLISFLVFIFIFTGKGRSIDKKEGIFLLLLYAAYLTFLIIS